MQKKILFDFAQTHDLSDWQIINDGVMGGKSTAAITSKGKDSAVFSGRVSLENSGGFASVRYNFQRLDMTAYKHFVLRLCGDGKRYQLRVRRQLSDDFSYIHHFETSGDREDIHIPLHAMSPSFRGQHLDMPDFAGDFAESISILINNKKAEEFSLELFAVVMV